MRAESLNRVVRAARRVPAHGVGWTVGLATERPLRFRGLYIAFGASLALLSVLAIVLSEDARWGMLPLAIGTGFVVIGCVPWRVPPTPGSELVLLVTLAVAYAAARAIQLAYVVRLDADDVLLIVTEAVVFVSVLHLGLLHACGVSRLAGLIAKTQPSGYAAVLDEELAEPFVAAELARCRRRAEPLHFVIVAHDNIEESAPRDRHFDARSIRYLESVYIHARICRLLSDHARRTDVVVCRKDGRFLIMSPGTDVAGAEMVAERLTRAAATELGATLHCDVGWLPADGETLHDLRNIVRVDATPAPPDTSDQVDITGEEQSTTDTRRLAAGQ